VVLSSATGRRCFPTSQPGRWGVEKASLGRGEKATGDIWCSIESVSVVRKWVGGPGSLASARLVMNFGMMLSGDGDDSLDWAQYTR
jgi:hypothetical protein